MYIFFAGLSSLRIDLPAPPSPKSNIFLSSILIPFEFKSAIKPEPSVDVALISLPYRQLTESRFFENSCATISLYGLVIFVFEGTMNKKCPFLKPQLYVPSIQSLGSLTNL